MGRLLRARIIQANEPSSASDLMLTGLPIDTNELQALTDRMAAFGRHRSVTTGDSRPSKGPRGGGQLENSHASRHQQAEPASRLTGGNEAERFRANIQWNGHPCRAKS